MLLIEMETAAPTITCLDELLALWAGHDHAVTDGTCVVCEGETFRVERRGGAQAWACRECGSVLEDALAVGAIEG